jgi:hypothetical protein
MNKLLGSSADPQKIALTIKGLLTSIVPIILVVCQAKGLDITDATLNPYIDLIYNTIIYGTLCWSGLMTLFGLIRKGWFWSINYVNSLKK